MKTQSNNLVYRTTKLINVSGRKGRIEVKISLNDEHKNGHQDFSITGNIYGHPTSNADKYFVSGGCIHDDIIKHFPEFIPFVRLHLCDFDGVPMHAAPNMCYFMREGFQNTPANSPAFKAEFCKYYRITPEQYDGLLTCKNVTQYAVSLQKLGVLDQWKREAQESIKQLEELTGLTFVNDSVKGQFTPPTPEEMAEESKKQAEGYYTPEAEAARKKEAKDKKVNELRERLNKGIAALQKEFEIKKWLIENGENTEDAIYYSHTNTIGWGWRNYGKKEAPEDVKKRLESKGFPWMSLLTFSSK